MKKSLRAGEGFSIEGDDSLKFGPVDRAVEQEAGIESMVMELSEEIERKMFREISGGDEPGQAYARRGRPRKWSDWEI